MLNTTQVHYGPKVIAWVKGLLAQEDVLPLALIGPPNSGKSHLVEGLKSWVRVHYLSGVLGHPKAFNDTMEYARVLVTEGEPVPRMYSHDRFVEITGPYRPRKEVPNRYAVVGCYHEDTDAIPDCAIKVPLPALGDIVLPSRKFLVLELLR